MEILLKIQTHLGGKTIMYNLKKKNEKLITYTGKESCLYTLTQGYLAFLGENHKGSLQPRCKPGYPNLPDPVKSIVYSLALSDLRQVIIYMSRNRANNRKFFVFDSSSQTVDLMATSFQSIPTSVEGPHWPQMRECLRNKSPRKEIGITSRLPENT